MLGPGQDCLGSQPGRDPTMYVSKARRSMRQAQISGLIFCSQFCSQPEGTLKTIWKRYEYMDSQNFELNSIAA
jgi:hypothetical protein